MSRSAHSVVVLSLILASLAVVQGCGTTCPSQPSPCPVTTTLVIPLPTGSPEVFDIALQFRTGDQTETDRCLAILPPPDDWTGNLPVSCLHNSASVWVERDYDADCSVSYPEGASCSVNPLGFVLSIRRAGRVDGMELQFTRADTTYAPISVALAYESYHPDGPDCPGACDVARTVVAFEALVVPNGP